MSLDLTPLGYRLPPSKADLAEMADLGANATKGIINAVRETLEGRHGPAKGGAVLRRTCLSIHWGTRMHHEQRK